MSVTAEPALPTGHDDGPRPRGRRRRIVSMLVLLAAAAATVAIVKPFADDERSANPGAIDNAYPTALATVRRRSLSSQTEVDGTLRFVGNASIVNGGTGVITALPKIGQVIGRGGTLYRMAGEPVVLLYGETPAYRTLEAGMSGRDVAELNGNLAALGYGTAWLDATSNEFTAATAYALEQLQDALGVEQTGRLDLGRAVFLPRATRITDVMATLGVPLQPGAIVAQGTSTRREVAVDLDASQQASIRPGDRVRIKLPNGRTTPGVVRSVGKVASGSADNATVPVHIRPLHPAVTGSLDRATVQVAITTARVKHALVVPVTSLLAMAGDGYAVETVDAHHRRRLVSVTTGLFDSADGLVQITGSRLSPGQKIVVPAS